MQSEKKDRCASQFQIPMDIIHFYARYNMLMMVYTKRLIDPHVRSRQSSERLVVPRLPRSTRDLIRNLIRYLLCQSSSFRRHK
jgi:hypothetical protein